MPSKTNTQDPCLSSPSEPARPIAAALEEKDFSQSWQDHLRYSLAKDEFSATRIDWYVSLALAIRDRLVNRWIRTQQTYYEKDAKRIYYLSMEFLIGRSLGNALINLGLSDAAQNAYAEITKVLKKTKHAKALEEFGKALEDIEEKEPNAALGNGGLGRLAACFLDSMATLELPAYGYGIRYDFGIFFQKIQGGYQVETPDNWLRYGNPWELARPEGIYRVQFYGHVHQYHDDKGILKTDWVETEQVMAMAYDTPVPGYQNNTVNNIRLWAAKATREFEFGYFNDGDYEKAVSNKVHTEIISKVLYPNDSMSQGKELRLKQEHFFVSASLQDIVGRYKKTHDINFDCFPDKVAIQLNDTHPAIAVAELMRILLDHEGLSWDKAWSITVNTFAYTNHTVLPEALEKWSVDLMGSVLPRHLQIIYEINHRFLQLIRQVFPGDEQRVMRMSLIEEGSPKNVRMAFLAIVGSHSVNGVSELHTEIIKSTPSLFKDFYELWPEKFNAKTNGITQRRWLLLCNPSLSKIISDKIGSEWVTDLYKLRKLAKFADDKDFQKLWQKAKRESKQRLADYIAKNNNLKVNVNSMFDFQVKRIHEYKRQLLNVLHVIWRYNQIKTNPSANFAPRTVIFAGKAAPGYFIAKLLIKLINNVADVINHDEQIGDKLKVVFLENYSVSLAEIIMPASDLSEQISTAGTEASGTGNMKFALNGALTIGTLDGANIEIMEEVSAENMFLFGLNAEQVLELKNSGYSPRKYYEEDAALKHVIDMIQNGYFCSPAEPGLFQPIINNLLGEDKFLLLADFRDYLRAQLEVDETYKNKEAWTKKSILNVANMGRFSSDRTIQEYAEEIWSAKPVSITFNGRSKKSKPKKNG
ncbi:glycogen/starch/alpha-glucan phosphorylase [Chloroherpeton thalassium ATCC 35110]|uniref:Alpha-1,4 glucan phosphorylase n=1 Tax=Chloroherpeton thalassium (strain ATCC 35110 / GB-78) TaxID=517418 RepID=B3QZ79_CHLT3|nr:glycogen/starch/alpha-glucan phosphorylase [Chloroherpeton thalassium]ACF13772.1 glycogen/starch/alpha-glucan phosphorylase [Chloroherpeton thalassium ATCC 35110]